MKRIFAVLAVLFLAAMITPVFQPVNSHSPDIAPLADGTRPPPIPPPGVPDRA